MTVYSQLWWTVQPVGTCLAGVEQHGGRFLPDAPYEALAQYGRPDIFKTDRPASSPVRCSLACWTLCV
jgi:hypothetical protein